MIDRRLLDYLFQTGPAGFDGAAKEADTQDALGDHLAFPEDTLEFASQLGDLSKPQAVEEVGGNEDDRLIGTRDDDDLRSSKGNDTLLGKSGNDTLKSTSGEDLLKGGGGADLIKFSADDIKKPPTTTIKAFQSIDVIDLGGVAV